MLRKSKSQQNEECVSIEYLWEMESEVCNRVFPRAHIEPELPLKDHQVGHVGLVAWETKAQL